MPESDAENSETVFDVPTVFVAYCATGDERANFAAFPASPAGTLASVSKPELTKVAASVPSYTLVEATDNVPPTVTVRIVMFADRTGKVSV